MPQQNWLSIWFVLSSLLKVSLALLSMLGLGWLGKKLPLIRTRLESCPSLAVGMLLHAAIAVLLSAVGALDRSLLGWLLLPGALFGLLHLMDLARSKLKRTALDKEKLFTSVLALPVVWLLLLGALGACRPNLEERDPQITYAVQPDRWLERGRIYFLDETVFSAFPVLGEIVSVWPAALAGDMLEQLVLLQLFQRCLLVLAVLIGASILGLRCRRLLLALFAVLSCNLLFGISGSAKVDMTALFFCTLALSLLIMERKRTTVDYSAFLLMGAALATKLTAYVVLLPFAALALSDQANRRRARIMPGIAVMLFLPVVFAIRTALHTGSPFYPTLALDFLSRPEWRMPELHPLLRSMVDRTSSLYPSYGFLGNVLELLRQWEIPIILFFAVSLTALLRRIFRRHLPVIIGVLGFLALCVAVFWPPWWGAKYTVLAIPFAALWATTMIPARGWVPVAYLLSSFVLFFLFFSKQGYAHARWELSRGTQLVESFASYRWRVEGKRNLYIPPNVPLQLWSNRSLPEDTRIVSLWEPKRYFCEHEWVAAWRHPRVRAIYLENSLRDEIEILRSLGTDYVVFGREDPLPLSAEEGLLLLDRIGKGDVLVPRLVLNHFVLCSFNPDNLGDDTEEAFSPPTSYAFPTDDTFSVAVENRLSGHVVSGVLAVLRDGRSTGNLLEDNIAAGKAMILVVPDESEHLAAYDESGESYLLRLPQRSGETCSINVSLAQKGFSRFHRGTGTRAVTIRNSLTGMGLMEIRVRLDSREGFTELLGGRVLFPGEELILWTDQTLSALTALDQRGRAYDTESTHTDTIPVTDVDVRLPDGVARPAFGHGALLVKNDLPPGQYLDEILVEGRNDFRREYFPSEPQDWVTLTLKPGTYRFTAFDNLGIAYDIPTVRLEGGGVTMEAVSVLNMRIRFEL
ncbi:hypothetical protein GF402_04825 [Candidatus Fermentibacteria bacterium]|nr:hypothetical protein [Candidatus Fermentibacteria bacterium]